MPTLYIVATPIGNLEDITLRAIRVLREVGLIAAEDTRVTRKLLERYAIHTPLTSYHEHNKAARLPALLEALAEKDVALVSDAGMPGINDPGAELVAASAERGFPVVPVPGPSALTTAIAVSGLPIEQFLYLGFLPRKPGERRRLLESLASERRALVAFETPHRLGEALRDALDVLGDRRIAVCRELTKLHEEVFRGTISGALAHFQQPRGEFTLVIEGASAAEAGARPALASAMAEDDVRALLARLRAEGLGARQAVSLAMKESGLPRRQVYRLWLEAKPSD